jgi:hypothetical protein
MITVLRWKGVRRHSVGPLRKSSPLHMRMKTDPVSETSCFYPPKTPEDGKVQQPSNSVCYTPSSEPYKIDYYIAPYILHILTMVFWSYRRVCRIDASSQITTECARSAEFRRQPHFSNNLSLKKSRKKVTDIWAVCSSAGHIHSREMCREKIKNEISIPFSVYHLPRNKNPISRFLDVTNRASTPH